MSDIPKSERSESSLETQHLVYALRRKITTELLTSFGYSEKKLEEHVKRVTAYIKDKEERKARQEMLLVLMQDFSMWLIEDERDDIADLCREISRHLRQANTIWPNYYAEYIERRLELDRARECCKLKKYKKKMDEGVMLYEDIENSFKSWLGGHYKYMTHGQIYQLVSLFYELFGRRPTWRKGHSRLFWMMTHRLRASSSTVTAL